MICQSLKESGLFINMESNIFFENVSGDFRRTIFANSSLLNGNEMSIIKLNKGKAIGGCIHSKDENYAVISGCVLISKGVENTIGLPGDAGTFEAGVPHAFYASEDSIVMEWGLTAEEKQNDTKDTQMLDVIKGLNLIR